MALPLSIFRLNRNKIRLLIGVSLGLIFLSVGLLGLVNEQKPNSTTWQSATVAAPPELLRRSTPTASSLWQATSEMHSMYQYKCHTGAGWKFLAAPDAGPPAREPPPPVD